MKKIFLLVAIIFCLAPSAHAQSAGGFWQLYWPFNSLSQRANLTSVGVTITSAAPVTLISPATNTFADIDWGQVFNGGVSNTYCQLAGGTQVINQYLPANGGGANTPNCFSSIKQTISGTKWIYSVASAGATVILNMEFCTATR